MTAILFLLLCYLGTVKIEDASMVVLVLVSCMGCDVIDFLVAVKLFGKAEEEDV